MKRKQKPVVTCNRCHKVIHKYEGGYPNLCSNCEIHYVLKELDKYSKGEECIYTRRPKESRFKNFMKKWSEKFFNKS